MVAVGSLPAVVGASDDLKKFGGRIIHYVTRNGYRGTVIPVNPRRAEVAGLPAVPSIGHLGPVDVAILAGGRQGDLPFEIEVVLASDDEPALEAARRGGQGGLSVAARHALAGFDLQVHRAGGGDVEGGRQLLIFDHGLGRGGAGGGERGGGDGEQALADAVDLIHRE